MGFAGPIRSQLPVYWTQCGNCRLDRGWAVGHPGEPNSGKTPVRSYEDVVALGREAAEHPQGFRSLKSMIFDFEGEESSLMFGGNESCAEPRKTPR